MNEGPWVKAIQSKRQRAAEAGSFSNRLADGQSKRPRFGRGRGRDGALERLFWRDPETWGPAGSRPARQAPVMATGNSYEGPVYCRQWATALYRQLGRLWPSLGGLVTGSVGTLGPVRVGPEGTTILPESTRSCPAGPFPWGPLTALACRFSNPAVSMGVFAERRVPVPWTGGGRVFTRAPRGSKAGSKAGFVETSAAGEGPGGPGTTFRVAWNGNSPIQINSRNSAGWAGSRFIRITPLATRRLLHIEGKLNRFPGWMVAGEQKAQWPAPNLTEGTFREEATTGPFCRETR